MKEQLSLLFEKQMSRKEFLQYVGSGLLVMFGVSGLLKALTGQSMHRNTTPQDIGYGSSNYGGSV